jgi:virginiamycin B lyase
VRVSSFTGPVALVVDDSIWIAQRGLRRRSALRRLDPATGQIVGAVEARPEFVAVTLTGDSLWAASLGGWPGARGYRGGSVARVDPATNRIVANTRVGRAPAAIAAGAGAVWVTNNLDDTVSRINPRTSQVVKTIRVGAGPAGVAVDENAVWVASNGDHTVSRIDPARMRSSRQLP